MLRLILTLTVGFALLIGVGAWFDPEGAREAIENDLAGLASAAADQAAEAVEAIQASGAVQEAVGQVAATAATQLARISGAEPAAAPKPGAGPRPRKKRHPIVAAAPTPTDAPLEVEELQLDARADFQPAPLDAEDTIPRPVAGLAGVPPDLAERGDLIRRMLALYARVSERK